MDWIIFTYPDPASAIVKDEILDDVETRDVTIPGSTVTSSNISMFLSWEILPKKRN